MKKKALTAATTALEEAMKGEDKALITAKNGELMALVAQHSAKLNEQAGGEQGGAEQAQRLKNRLKDDNVVDAEFEEVKDEDQKKAS